MPPPRKAAKKTAGHRHDKHHPSNDLRRTYEHMGRLELLRKSLNASTASTVAELTRLAQRAIKDGQNKDAAELLRASEHLSFGVLIGEVSVADRISAELEQAIQEQFDALTRRADEHWSREQRSSALAGFYEAFRSDAARAFDAQAYHQALEFARAAEALAHVKQHGPLKLEGGDKHLQLKSV